MEFYQIRYFLTLCETLNFTRAAERCNVTQPSLTRAIKLLEDELGGPLVNRERNHTHLTRLGEIMRPQLEQVHDQAMNAKRRARSMLDLTEGSLRIGIMNSAVTKKMIGVIDQFRQVHCGVDLHLIAAGPGDVRELLTEGEVDTAIYSSPEVDPPDFHVFELFRERFTVAVGPGHRFEKLSEVRISDLAGERYLVREHWEHEPQFDQLLAEHAVRLGGRYRSDRDDWINAMTVAGFGFCVLPEGALSCSDLVMRRLVDPELERVVSLLTMRGRPHSPALSAFLQNLRRIEQAERTNASEAMQTDAFRGLSPTSGELPTEEILRAPSSHLPTAKAG